MGEAINCMYQLRRIGPPKSLDDVQDVMRLRPGCARFGRSFLHGSENEFFLDSAIIKYFISRRHAEIYIKEDGECLLVDLGLNGTYINDKRVDGKCLLHLGDRVTFGHTNGIKIKPGAYAPQPLSEFQFVFEKTRPCSSQSVVLDAGKEENLCKIELKFESQPEHPHEGHSPSEGNSKEELVAGEISCDFDDNNVVAPPGGGPDELSLTPTAVYNIGSADDVTSSTPLPATCAMSADPKPLSAPKDISVIVLESSDDSDIEDCPVPKIDSGHQSYDSEGDPPAYVVLNSSEPKCKTPIKRQLSHVSTESIVVIGQEELEDDSPGSPIIPDMSNQSHTPILSPNTAMTGRQVQLAFPEADPPVFLHVQSSDASSTGTCRVVLDAGFVSCSEEESVEGDTTVSGLPQLCSNQQQRPTKRRYQKRGRRKKRCKLGQDENGVQLYEIATCASVNCIQPDSKKIGWVQCDSCDQWYHTTCVGCNYSQVQDEDIEFHCGCC